MKIKEIEWQNFKSYGQWKQSIKFDDEGGLILLAGGNGTGKSTIRDVIDLCLYNKVPGKRKKFTPNTSLPNRHNGSLYAGMRLENHNDDDINILKWISPNKNKIIINNLDETDWFKKLSTEQRDNLLGFSYDTFKSFISMSMNDFKNFIVLKNTEKVNLLNKLFNLEKIDQLSTITKDYIKQLDKSIELNYNKYTSNKELLDNTKKILKTVENREVQDISKLKEKLKSKKPDFENLQTLIKSKTDELVELNNKIKNYSSIKSKQESELHKLEIDIDNIKEKLELYDKGICPYCESYLDSDKHHNKKEELKYSLKELKSNQKSKQSTLDEMITELSKVINQKNNKSIEINSTKEDFDNLKSELIELKTKIKSLKKESEQIDITELTINHDTIKDETYEIQKKISRLKKKKEIYKSVLDIISKNNTKKDIIKKSIVPINNYIKDFSEKTKSSFNVKLNEEFDAIINERTEIDPELLSGGEDRKINIIIALSYLCSMLDKKHVNILFIDELFNSIDKENIDLILKLLKEIALKYKINIILVHHYLDIMDLKYFKKIIKVKKDIFSELEIIENNEYEK